MARDPLTTAPGRSTGFPEWSTGEDGAEDLDGPVGAVEHQDARRGFRWPRATPSWARGPLGALGAAALAAVLTGVVAVHSVQARAQERGSAEQARLWLQPGTPAPMSWGLAGPADAEGESSFAVLLPVLDRGPVAVSVSVEGFSAPFQRTRRPPAAVRVAPGATATVPLTLAVRCADVPAAAGSRGPAAPDPPASDPPASDPPASAPVRTSVRARVDVPGRSLVVDLPLLAESSRAFADQISAACHPDPTTGVTTTASPLPDGSLHVHVEDTIGTTPLRLGLQASPGLGVVSDVPLPVPLAPRTTVDLVLSVRADCAAVGRGSGASVDLVALDAHGPGVHPLDDRYSAPDVERWLARQVALACG